MFMQPGPGEVSLKLLTDFQLKRSEELGRVMCDASATFSLLNYGAWGFYHESNLNACRNSMSVLLKVFFPRPPASNHLGPC